MKKQLLLSLLGVGLVLGACSDDKDPVVYPNDGNLSITTSIFSNVNNYAFANNEKIGLFVTENETGEWYKTNPYSNVMATSVGIGKLRWDFSQVVPLNDNPALVFAYYPYDADVVNPYSIPIQIDREDKMVDYMYGSNRQTQKVTRDNPNADLIMNHALSMIQFDISIDKNQPYHGTGIIEDARIVALDNDGKLIQNKDLVQSGYLNCITGYIEPLHWGSIKIIDLIGKSFHGNFSGRYPVCMVALTYRMSHTAFMINVDGREFYLPLPEGTTWAKNTKNRYVITLSGMELKFDGNSVIVEDWTDGGTSGGEFGGGGDF